MDNIEGIYTAYLAGATGQGMAMFVFQDHKIAGADVSGLVFSGSYSVEKGMLIGELVYTMPVGSTSITGASFDQHSDRIVVPLSLPAVIDPNETYCIDTPIGPINAKLVKNIGLGSDDNGK